MATVGGGGARLQRRSFGHVTERLQQPCVAEFTNRWITAATERDRADIADAASARQIAAWALWHSAASPVQRRHLSNPPEGRFHLLHPGQQPLPSGGLPAIYAEGGYTGPGGKYQPAGIVHRGEYVFDQESVKRLGVGTLDRLRGYADGGYVGMPSMPSIPAVQGGGGSSNITVHSGSIVIQGDASEKTVALIKAALKQHDATMQPKIVAAVTLARKQRQLV